MTVTPETLRTIAANATMGPGALNWVNAVQLALTAAAEEIEAHSDKIEGLDADLRMAVQTAYDRGATEWARLNYPQWIEWLEASAK